MRLFKEPLLHFLLLGFCLFIAYQWVADDIDAGDEGRVVVDRNTLLSFMQYRAKAFDTQHFEKQLDKMPQEQRDSIVNDYVREEVLFREAKALSLDKNDYVARQRLIQQMRYLTQSLIDSGMSVAEDELNDFYAANASRYKEAAHATFTHVFFSTQQRSDDDAKSLAQQKLLELNRLAVPFYQALGHGERFLYHRNYVKKDLETVASHFGSAMQAAVFSANPSDTQWYGPFQSPYGFHLVLLAQQTAERLPPISEIKDRLYADVLQDKGRKALDKAVEALVSSYDIVHADDLNQAVQTANDMSQSDLLGSKAEALNPPAEALAQADYQ